MANAAHKRAEPLETLQQGFPKLFAQDAKSVRRSHQFVKIIMCGGATFSITFFVVFVFLILKYAFEASISLA
jgi:hypothetical protein